MRQRLLWMRWSVAFVAVAVALGPIAASAAYRAGTPAKIPRHRHFTTNAVLDLGGSDVTVVGAKLHDPGNGSRGRWEVRHFNGIEWSEQGEGTGAGWIAGLDTISAVTPTDVWAGGYGPDGALAAHYDGSSWQEVATPAIAGAGDLYLASISARTANDVWAVGSCDIDEGPFVPVIEHWNGRRWSLVSGPVVGQQTDELQGVAAVAAGDVWAVGEEDGHGLIQHWDGMQWAVVTTTPRPLMAVTAISADDVWAVGSGNGNGAGADALHWDGTTWSSVPMPPFHAHETLYSVSGSGPDDVWAVGNAGNGPYGRGAAVIQHWDGHAWHIVRSAITGGGARVLWSVSVDAPDDAWAVGSLGEGDDGYQLVLHWDGSTWTQLRVGK